MALHLGVLAAVATCLILGKAVFDVIYNLFFSPLRVYPGPKLWAVTSLPFNIVRLNGYIERSLLRLHEKYGPVVRVGPTDLSYANDQVFRDVFAIRQGHQEFMKWNKVTPHNGVKGLLSADRDDHARYRKLLSHAFSEKGLREQEARVMSYVNLLVQRLRERAPHASQDMVSWFNWTTFDMIGDLAFGESFGCLENSREHFWIEAIFGNLKGFVWARFLIQLGQAWLIPYITPKKVKALRNMNQTYADEKVRSRVQMRGPRGDFFDRVLQKKPGEGGMTEPELASNASNLVLGGSETTATLLSGTLSLLVHHPDILQKVQGEVRSTFASDGDITIVGVNQLHYMLAVLQEAMRVYPPVPILQTRLVPGGGDTVNGSLLPGGTNIHVSTYAINHLSANFARPEDFIPERWTLTPEEKEASGFANDNTAAFQPFSVGTRNCIGRNLAYAEMRLMLAKLLYHFDIMSPDDRPPQPDWISKQRTWILWEKDPLWIKLAARDTQQ